MKITSIITALLAAALALTGCVTVSSKSVDSDITSYEYDQKPFSNKYKLTHVYPIRASIVTETDQGKGTSNYYLELTEESNGEEPNILRIYQKDIGKFRQLLKLKMRVQPGQQDQQASIILNHLKFMIQTKFIKGERVIAMGSLDGLFAFKDADIHEINRLLDILQQQS